MIFNTPTDSSDSIYNKKTPTGSKNAWNALLFSIGANKSVPYVAGRRAKATLNFPSTAAQTSSNLTIPCIGAKIGDIVSVGGPVPAVGSFYSGYVSALGVVTVRYNNYSAGALDPVSAVFSVIVTPSGV